MEPMRIRVEALQLQRQWVVARVRAVAVDANIRLLVRFPYSHERSYAALRRRARSEALRYLDPA